MIEKLKELYKELYEDMQINIKIRQGLDEGKIKKFDDNLLYEMSFYDFYDLPMLVILLRSNIKLVNLKEVSKGLLCFLEKRGKINLLESRNRDYYLIELSIDNKKYIYDVSTKLVYDKDYYYKINSDVSYNIIYSKEEFKDDFQDTTSFIKFAKMSEVRTKLVSQLIRDYKRGYSDTVASEITLNNYYKKEIDSKYLKLVKNED